jgi:acylphosphatase
MAELAKHVRVTGRVQGVFYRAWAQGQARELGVSGWIRNCADGSVEALVEGDPNTLDLLIEKLRKGPPGAMVSELSVEPAETNGAEGFEIR